VFNPVSLPSFYYTQNISVLPDSMQYCITHFSVSQTEFRKGVSVFPRDGNAWWRKSFVRRPKFVCTN